MIPTSAGELFMEGVNLVQQNFFIDARQKFLELVNAFPQSDLTDDALYNAGLCNFHLNAFEQAIETFRQVISSYPDGDIFTYGSHVEYGKTAAKCHYAIVNCYLGLAKLNEARGEAARLIQYPEAYILTGLGEKVTFISLADKALQTYSQFNV